MSLPALHTTALLDLGNRRLKGALWDGRSDAGGAPLLDAVSAWTLPPADGGWSAFDAQLRAWLADAPAVALSSSNPRAFERLLRGALHGADLRLAGSSAWPFPVRSRGTGSDRVLAAYAAWRRSRAAVLVASLGTAWTLDAMDASGAFLGGAIGAGLRVQEEALAAAAPHLPPPASAAAPIPDDSASAVACGTRAALAAALDGLAARFETAMAAPARRFVTGGDTVLLQPWLSAAWQPEPSLVLHGLALWLAA
ncbi:MAG: type III pantothenate kinase [Planctomycetota bacterium]|nr:MAG: type III pantothenate kinase [Planctomycetota bacterium]